MPPDFWTKTRFSLKVLTYMHFESPGGPAYLGVNDLKVLIITDAPERVQKLMRLIRARMAWCADQADYLQDYHSLRKSG